MKKAFTVTRLLLKAIFLGPLYLMGVLNADFGTIKLECNNATTGSPAYQAIGGANTEVRWSDSASQKNIASTSWPAMIRPAATSQVNYTYAYTADATGDGLYANGGACPTYSKDNYRWARWNWTNDGTFASAPIFTAYPTTAHGAITGGDGSLLGGHATDTSSYSYLKGNLYGQVTATADPAAGPSNAPTVTSGTGGSVNPTAGANWIANFQALQGDTNYITFAATPTATTAGSIACHFALFTGPNMTPSTYTVVMTLKYTWT